MGTIIMNAQLAKLKRVVIFLATIFTASISAMAYADWSIIGLGTLGGASSEASGINDSGQVVGSSVTASGYTHAFITGPNGIGMTDLGTLGRNYSRASGINDSGQVVGDSVTAKGYIDAFITGPNGIGMTGLGSSLHYRTTGINDSGQVVGYSGPASGDSFHAFITGPNGIGVTDLGTLGGAESFAFDINNSGQVVGQSETAASAGGYTHAFITGPNGVGMIDIGTLGGAIASSSSGINDSGQVVGTSYIEGDVSAFAFITGLNGIGMINLGTLGGFYSFANAINDSGEVVGLAATAIGELHSFIFSHEGITDLSLLAPVVTAGWTDIVVNSINNNGQMVGYGDHNGNKEAFLLSYTSDTVFDPKPIYIPPVPEPETYLMLLGGLGLIGYLVRRGKATTI